MGRCEGATAEEAVPFPSDRPSILVVLRFAAILWGGSITCRVLRREASRVRHHVTQQGSFTQLGNGNDLGFLGMGMTLGFA